MLSCVVAIPSWRQARGSGTRRWRCSPSSRCARSPLASSGILCPARCPPAVRPPSKGLSSLPLNCNVGGRSRKHIVCRNKTEWFFLFVKVVMVQLVAKPLLPPPWLSFPSASLLFLSWEEVAASESTPSFSPTPSSQEEGQNCGGCTQISPGAPGPRVVSQGSAGVEDDQQADNVSSK